MLVVATAVCLLIDCPAQARAPVGESEPGRSPAGAFDHGVLWKVSGRGGEGGRPSYLFGTIHSDDPRVVQLPRQVRAAFDESDHFCMELLLDPRASSVLAQSVVFPQGQDLRAMIGGTLFEQIVPLMADHGVPEQALLRLKPWAVLMILSSPKQKTGRVLDLSLHERAKRQGKSTCGLETVEEQVAIFDTASVAEQLILLRDTVKRYSQLPDLFTRLIDRYLARDLAGLLTLSQESGPTDAAVKRVFDVFMRRLLDQRNPRLLDRMDAAIRAGGAFIAVGALHLPGEQGLLRLLHQQGYALEAVY